MRTDGGNVMSESTGAIPGIDETDTEIELSAQDLLALSAPTQVVEPASGPALPAAEPVKRASPRKLVLSLALTVAAVGVAVTYGISSSGGASQPVASTSQQIAQMDEPAPQSLADSQPVRFVNPFDAGEVFEFPAGTTQTQARDAVAEVLMERALSRQKS
jgi:hypothetical protein